MKQNRFTGVMGLRLSRQALRVLKDRGIFAHSPVTLEHQHLAGRYVVRGLVAQWAMSAATSPLPAKTASQSSACILWRPSE